MSKKANLKTYSFWHPSVSSYNKENGRARSARRFVIRYNKGKSSRARARAPWRDHFEKYIIKENRHLKENQHLNRT